MDKIKAFFDKNFDIHAAVFYPSSVIIILFVGLTLIIGAPMQQFFESVSDGMTTNAGWFFVLAANAFLAFCIYLIFSPFGNIRLGGRNAEPEFSMFGWFSMLFSAGMGIGLLFFSVAEPILHFSNPPIPADSQAEAAQNAMKFTFLHYGMHAWAIYTVVGLSLAYFAFNKKLPLTIRSVFYPILGEKIHGPIGNIIDVIAVVATLFGLATSLGFGVKQVSSGLHHLFNTPDTVTMQVFLILFITLLATASVVLGIDKGVRKLSEFNIRLAFLFLIFMLIVGPTVFLLDGFIQNTGAYLADVIEIGTWMENYTGGEWQHDWSVFYWAWWISWSPFVGMFIARVSRGRTVREFVLSVLIVPSVLTFLWMSVFGGAALFSEFADPGSISEAVNENIAIALFVMLEEYPLTFLTSIIGILLVTVFFVTSSDSGSLVIDSITSGGKLDAPVGQRIFWALSEGAVAATLILGGGLAAMQTAAISAGLPFTFLLFIMCFSLYKGLKSEQEDMREENEKRERVSYTNLIKDIVEKRKQNTDDSSRK
jgi:choline/glycine/proline betaine transport protein